MREKLSALGIETCADLQRLDQIEFSQRFGRWGIELWSLCRGVDDRAVTPDRTRKSVSSETTFSENIEDQAALIPIMTELIHGLSEDLAQSHADRSIRSLVVKLKFADFCVTSAERAGPMLDPRVFEELLTEAWKRGKSRPVRLLGVGVRFHDPKELEQMEFF
jgi:DNA polymerase-4